MRGTSLRHVLSSPSFLFPRSAALCTLKCFPWCSLSASSSFQVTSGEPHYSHWFLKDGKVTHHHPNSCCDRFSALIAGLACMLGAKLSGLCKSLHLEVSTPHQLSNKWAQTTITRTGPQCSLSTNQLHTWARKRHTNLAACLFHSQAPFLCCAVKWLFPLI